MDIKKKLQEFLTFTQLACPCDTTNPKSRIQILQIRKEDYIQISKLLFYHDRYDHRSCNGGVLEREKTYLNGTSFVHQIHNIRSYTGDASKVIGRLLETKSKLPFME